ncbi:MAG: hypothetical protein WC517_03775 [Patescibacteria group bacterium]
MNNIIKNETKVRVGIIYSLVAFVVGVGITVGIYLISISMPATILSQQPLPATDAYWDVVGSKADTLTSSKTNVVVRWQKSKSDNVGKQLLMIYSNPQCKKTIQWHNLSADAESYELLGTPNSTIYFKIYSYETDGSWSSTFCSPPLQIDPKAKSDSLYSFEFINPDSGINYILSAYPAYGIISGKDYRLSYVDQSFDNTTNIQKRDIYGITSADGKKLFVSHDLGLKWNFLFDLPQPATRGFITSSGSIILFDTTSSKLMRLLKDGDNYKLEEAKIISNQSYPAIPPEYIWHGSQGIGQSGDTIMFAEYWADESDKKIENRVYRSRDDGQSWEVVYSLPSTNSSTAPFDMQIRHFHTLQADPYYLGHWYLSSGDTRHSKIWLSKDNGGTWKEISDPLINKDLLPEVHRYTSIQFLRNSLIWPTDDILHGAGAKIVKARRGEPINIYETFSATVNHIRNITRTPIGYIILTENSSNIKIPANNNKPGFEIALFTPANKFQYIGFIPKSGVFTSSLASRQTIDWTFLSYFRTDDTINDYKGILRWELRRKFDDIGKSENEIIEE